MNCTERQVIEDFRQKLVRTVDPIAIATTLYLQKHCKRELFEKIRDKSDKKSSREQIWNTFLPNIILFCQFGSFWLALYTSGYELLSIELLLQFWQQNLNTELTADQSHTECEKQGYFLLLKVSFHDRAFREPHELLYKTLEGHRTKYEEAINTREKVCAADRYADCLCVVIDTKAMEFIGKLPTHELFDNLKAIIPETSNTSLTEVGYYSRLAIAHGMADMFEEGRRFVTKAQMAAFQINQSAQYVYNMLYIHIHFLCMQASIPKSADIDGIIDVAKRFLQSIPDQDEGAVFWKKMVALRIVCFLLGISHKGHINEKQKVEKKHVALAKTFLEVIDARWDRIEYIRRLFYFVCQARIQELDFQEHRGKDKNAVERLELAIDQLQGTVAKDPENTFRETPFATCYISRLRQLISKT
ncbi:uncharacterized protein LOC110464927 [Mizuhopecten yessoensis]|uniref:uncharacterized protein LOC110464927 n=1 Tax=Mizuhopecten yessoensis TaxID=6573 RepID=UPI000B45AA2A|nr:uncharacterized protein LOC110464927 [Mizuhopecten yessoensis]